MLKQKKYALEPLTVFQSKHFHIIQCSIAHLSESGKIIHYGIALFLFLLASLAATIVSYTRVAEIIRQHIETALIGDDSNVGQKNKLSHQRTR